MLPEVAAGRLHHIHVELDRLLLAAQEETDGLPDVAERDAQDGGYRADIDHVLDVVAQARRHIHILKQILDRHRIVDQIIAAKLNAPVVRVEHHPARHHPGDILGHGSHIHGDQDCRALLPAEIAILAHPDPVPGGQPLDVGGKQVLAADRNAHLEQGAQQHAVGCLAAGTVDCRSHDGEIVDDRVVPDLVFNGL